MALPAETGDRVVLVQLGLYLLICVVLQTGNPSEPEPVPPQLVADVEAYWAALAEGDKVSAETFVLPAYREAFNRRDLGLVGRFRLGRIEITDDGVALVSAVVERLDPLHAQFREIPIVEAWHHTPAGWQVEVLELSSSEVNRLLFGRSEEDVEARDEVRLVPEQLRLQFLNNPQQGRFLLFNQSTKLVEVSAVKIAGSALNLRSEVPARAAPGGQIEIDVEYVGPDAPKELEYSVRFMLTVGSESQELVRRVVANHIGPETRAFFGLTTEQAEALKRGDVLVPVLRHPGRIVPPGEMVGPERNLSSPESGSVPPPD